ncbi:hypothetical protein LXL04_033216 [Taraxacum kok-saghyz]
MVLESTKLPANKQVTGTLGRTCQNEPSISNKASMKVSYWYGSRTEDVKLLVVIEETMLVQVITPCTTRDKINYN